MKAMITTKAGGPEVLHLDDVDQPVPSPHELLVRVKAAGVNRPDLLQRQGLYPPPPGASEILGLEIAGDVVAVGKDVQRFKRGDAVCGLVAGGGYAEFCTVAADNALPIPQNLSFVEAAGIPETYFTVWTNVFDRGALKPGETLLVHGGASGIGTTAIQLAKALGSQVVVTCGSDEKAEQCLGLGCDLAINYRRDDFVAILAEKKIAPNVILDMIGGDYVGRNIRCAAKSARIVMIAFQQGSLVTADLMPLMVKRLVLTGSTLRVRSVAEKAVIARALEEKIWPLLSAGTVKPQIYKSFPLSEAAAAHRALEQGQHFGKIILTL